MEQETEVVSQPTLEELASSLKVEQKPTAQSFDAPEQPPSFENTEEYSKWTAKQLGNLTERFNSVHSELQAEKEKTFVDSRLKSLDSAVSEIGKQVNISKLMIEGVFHAKYARDQSFQKIFDNRDANPDAYRKALNLLTEEIKKEATTKYDPEVEENNRAMKQLHKAQRSPNKTNANEKYRGMSATDFDQEWQKLLQG